MSEQDLDPWYEARELLVEALVSDLVGGPEEAILSEPPLSRYIVGILYPRDNVAADEVILESADGSAVAKRQDDSIEAPGVSLSRVRLPSSIGLTFDIPAHVDDFIVTIRAARFCREDSPTRPPGVESAQSPEQLSGAAEPERVRLPGRRARRGVAPSPETWRRIPIEPPPIAVETGTKLQQIALEAGLTLFVYVRPPFGGTRAVTVTLVNEKVYDSGSADPRDALAYFQPAIEVECSAGLATRRPDLPAVVDDPDLRSDELLYRDIHSYAVGHGCAVTWDDGVPPRVARTVLVPSYELHLAEPVGGAGTLDLSMARLARGEGLEDLRKLVTAYREWIGFEEIRIDGVPPHLQQTGLDHLNRARKAADRVSAGIDLIDPSRPESDPAVVRAFRLMNEAMNAQRVHQERARARVGGRRWEERPQLWRPFQIAFILLNLQGLADPTSADRDVVDLLWFPTGGGKTEAYLGAIGFSILLRRIRIPRAGGVSVIMRYTLRLLTTQQFERATALICALELLRQRELPTARDINIGLWVGQKATPNSVADAATALRKLRQGDIPASGNPMQLLTCPWCGESLTADDYIAITRKRVLKVMCPNKECDFRNGLPLELVDENIYGTRPSLVLGTVDKFAMTAWKAETASLFGRIDGDPPPDLIIQDELHLISGPLGTMVGLYETAIDEAATGTARPKVIASTATIRRAESQVRAVFNRPSAQFPPPGLDPESSFFAQLASRGDKGTRLYLGVLAPGASQTTLLVRVYAALLQRAKDMNVSDEVRDTYWTLVGYFNSLRLLGGAFLQVLDDVPDRLEVIARRKGSMPRELDGEPAELTSRVTSEEIPRALKRLGLTFGDPEAVDVVLATNMISVGVDVDRLGLMAVMGQPQLTAEYIQATSRVGRVHPGLVVTMYNGARSRDKSHYENFTTYHRTLYRSVEATGATPFAARARDRGLHGVLVALVRLLTPELRDDQAVANVKALDKVLPAMARRIVDRCVSVAPEEAEATRAQLDELIDAWMTAAELESVSIEKYAGWQQEPQRLLWPAGTEGSDGRPATFPPDDPPWPTMTSLRDVDVETDLKEIFPRRKRSDR